MSTATTLEVPGSAAPGSLAPFVFRPSAIQNEIAAAPELRAWFVGNGNARQESGSWWSRDKPGPEFRRGGDLVLDCAWSKHEWRK